MIASFLSRRLSIATALLVAAMASSAHPSGLSSTAPTGAFPAAGMTARLATNSTMMVVCSPLSRPQRIWSLARNATGIAIAAKIAGATPRLVRLDEVLCSPDAPTTGPAANATEPSFVVGERVSFWSGRGSHGHGVIRAIDGGRALKTGAAQTP